MVDVLLPQAAEANKRGGGGGGCLPPSALKEKGMFPVKSSISGLHSLQRRKKATQKKASPDLCPGGSGAGGGGSSTDQSLPWRLTVMKRCVPCISDSGQLAIMQHRYKLQKGQEKADDKNVAKRPLQVQGGRSGDTTLYSCV